MTAKVLISMPDELASKMRAAIPLRRRSAVICKLLEKEIDKHEQSLYKAALAAEKDQKLKKEMQDWDVTSSDGTDDESW